ncbi:MAG: NADH-quinone oxidoreductase subunit E, partial [Alistipes sp.]|nr:NADH-quinone oxidoreductase subunit E [Alistipes sp.]
MFLFTLLALALATLILFLTPVRFKSRVTFLITLLGSLLPAFRAIQVLWVPSTGGLLWLEKNLIFGLESGSMDPLSALFVLIIALGGVATTLYACG